MEPSDDDDTPVPPTLPNPLPEAADPSATLPPTPQMRQLDDATAAEREEVRRLVDAGASSPEDLRALAEKMREQRERERQVWETEVKPSLHQARKRRMQLSDLRSEPDTGRKAERKFLVIAGVSVFLVLLVLTMSSAPLVVIAFLLAVLLAYAYASGRHHDGEPPAAPDDTPDDDSPPAEGEPNG